MKNKMLLNVSYGITRVMVFVMGAAIGLALVMTILSSLNVTSPKWHASFGIPIALESVNKNYPVDFDKEYFSEAQIEVNAAELEVKPSEHSKWQALAYLHISIYMSFIWFGLFKLSSVLKNVKANTPFSVSNYKAIRTLGLLTLGLAAYSTIFRSLASFLFSGWMEHISDPGFSLVANFNLNFETLFFGMLLLVLAEVFKAGNDFHELEEQTV